jgi:hypothetical protein
VTAAAADPTRTVVVPPLAAAAGAPASLVIALADSFGNIVDEDLTTALHVTLSGPASLNSPDVCPSVCFSSGRFATVLKATLEHGAVLRPSDPSTSPCAHVPLPFSTHAGGECGVSTQRHVRRSFQNYSGRVVHRACFHPQCAWQRHSVPGAPCRRRRRRLARLRRRLALRNRRGARLSPPSRAYPPRALLTLFDRISSQLRVRLRRASPPTRTAIRTTATDLRR